MYGVSKGAARILVFCGAMWMDALVFGLPFIFSHFPSWVALGGIIGVVFAVSCGLTSVVARCCGRRKQPDSQPPSDFGTSELGLQFSQFIIMVLLMMHAFLFHMSKAYHSGDDYLLGGWRSQEEEFGFNSSGFLMFVSPSLGPLLLLSIIRSCSGWTLDSSSPSVAFFCGLRASSRRLRRPRQ